MDSLTHAVAGVALAVTLEKREADSPVPARITPLVVGALGGLSPDVDALYWLWKPFGSEHRGLSYMFYHRAHTHTLIGCALLAALLVLPFVPFQRARAGRLFLLAFLAALLHVVMDATNDYGAHPFWPVYNGWFYGDFIFLLEPLVVTALLPCALGGILQDWGSRRVNLTVLGFAALLVLGWLALPWVRVAQGVWVTPLVAAFVTVWFAGQLAAALCFEKRAATAWTSLLAVYLAFFVGSQRAKALTRAELAANVPGEALIQLVTTPAPANPLCFRVVSASYDASRTSVVTRVGSLSLLPRLFEPGNCRTAADSKGTFELTEFDFEPTQRFAWKGEARTSVAKLDELAKKNCRVAVARRFQRTPILQTERGMTTLGDLRLDYGTALDEYCKYRFDESDVNDCDFPAVPWLPPFFSPESQTELERRSNP